MWWITNVKWMSGCCDLFWWSSTPAGRHAVHTSSVFVCTSGDHQKALWQPPSLSEWLLNGRGSALTQGFLFLVPKRHKGPRHLSNKKKKQKKKLASVLTRLPRGRLEKSGSSRSHQWLMAFIFGPEHLALLLWKDPPSEPWQKQQLTDVFCFSTPPPPVLPQKSSELCSLCESMRLCSICLLFSRHSCFFTSSALLQHGQ